jgi:hypothetical protein
LYKSWQYDYTKTTDKRLLILMKTTVYTEYHGVFVTNSTPQSIYSVVRHFLGLPPCGFHSFNMLPHASLGVLRVLRGGISFLLIVHIRLFGPANLLVPRQQRKCGSDSPAQNLITQQRPNGVVKYDQAIWPNQNRSAVLVRARDWRGAKRLPQSGKWSEAEPRKARFPAHPFKGQRRKCAQYFLIKIRNVKLL